MLKMRLPNGQEWVIENPFDQVFSTETEEGVQYHWNVTKALRIARERGVVHIVSLSQMGVTVEMIPPAVRRHERDVRADHRPAQPDLVCAP